MNHAAVALPMESERREETALGALGASSHHDRQRRGDPDGAQQEGGAHGLPERELDASRHSGRIDVLHGEVSENCPSRSTKM